MKTSFNLNDRVIYEKDGKDWVGTIHIDASDAYVVKFDDPKFGGWSDKGVDNLWYVSEAFLKPLGGDYNFYLVPLAEMKRIHDVACDDWKKRIVDMIKPFAESVVVNHKMAESMLGAATRSQRPVVEEVLKNAGYKFEDKAEYFEFEHGDNVISTYEKNTPLIILNGLADDGFEYKEVGFIDETDWMPVLVRKDGTEEDITGLKLRFKKRK